jgi:hypothetical protein
MGKENNPIDITKLELDAVAIKTVCLLINEDPNLVGPLSCDILFKCDKVVEILGLDKHRARYFSRSRSNDQS